MDDKIIVCSCFQRSKKQILKAIRQQKLRNVADVGRAIDAGTNCGRCQIYIQAIFDEINQVNEGLFASDNKC